QSILQKEKIPYTGSGVEASRLAMDKIASRERFRASNISTPKNVVFEKGKTGFSEAAGSLSLPIVVKPQQEGSSIGLSVIRKREDIAGGVEKALKYGPKAILEEYIQGRELTVGILRDDPLPVIEISARDNVYDYSAKYDDPDTVYTVPAAVDPDVYKRAQELGLKAHRALGCSSFSRVDMMMDSRDMAIYVLEVNSIPGMTERSLFPKAAQAAGIGFGELCLRITEQALR
ncbi:D-alanine--D-alanine ligase, partial [Candidatus Omnitrophota bacterium]